MADLAEIQQRGQDVFLALARDEVSPAGGFNLADDERPFSWFHEPDAWEATALAIGLSARTFAEADPVDGLDRALDDVTTAAATQRSGMVRQALSMFVTHDPNGRSLIKPRILEMAPEYFPSSPPGGARFDLSIGGAAPELDYWREDALANEHHEHWHQVYPFTGVPKTRDFPAMVQEIGTDELARIFEIWRPGQNWADQLANASIQQIAAFLADWIGANQFRNLAVEDQRMFVKANDRHGELFIYMHAQMLARYDAELAAWNLDPVAPWGPGAWGDPIPPGHDPVGLDGFTRREADAQLPDQWIDLLNGLQAPIDQALQDGQARQQDGTFVDLDPAIVGEMIEAASRVTSDLDTGQDATYEGMHNTGHGVLAALAPSPGGVMNNPVVAIRDPIFWRWHKHIDNQAAQWADEQQPHSLDDAPNVIVRSGLADPATPWMSPDIILVKADLLPADPAAAGVTTFGGANWDVDASAAIGPAAAAVTSELTTGEGQRSLPGGGTTMYLQHQAFGYYLRVENPSIDQVDVTARIFMVPSDMLEQRRRWIEMDKFRLTLEPGRNVVYRPDTESVVIKRPAETDPDAVGSASSQDENGYCDCGWPYTLLLPRGTDDGTDYRMVVMFTDWAIDQVPDPDHCGSMSFCGAVERYPDNREMGYPFNRPFADEIEATFLGHEAAAGTSLTIRHIVN